ncbi:MAG: insulinase family protein [Spirochaetaceae bacterium]|nr:insulinase family protein [Spirochaetaceae bacterium]
MKRIIPKRGLGLAMAAALALAAAGPLAAAPRGAAPEKARAPAHKVLSNGLEVFVVENRAVPLATVCVVFRGGASAQTPENAGLFHLYEHMLFTANGKYPNQAAFTAALNKMGVSSWNGATGSEYINYYITVPSDKLEDGVEFWSWAVKKPVFDAAKLESEKDVVINEIRGYHADPDQIMENALESRMFPAHPWRKNIDGPEENIRKATVAQLEAMRAAYYIPKNTALLVGGDVSPERAFALAEKWFGDWRGGAAPAIAEPAQGPLPAGVRLVYADPEYYEGVAQAQFRWRGPDVMRQTKDTYVADVLLYLLSSPVGRFKSALMEKGPGLYDPEYISFNYPTARDGGALSFSTFLVLEDPKKDGPTLDRVKALGDLVVEEFALIAKDPAAYFGAAELDKAKGKLVDLNLLSTEVASSYVTDTLTFWWAVATTDYFLGYEKNCRAVSFADIKEFIGRYLLSAPRSEALRLSGAAFDAEEAMAERMKTLGFEAVDQAAAFWWQRR